MSEVIVLIVGIFIGWVVPCPHSLQIGINKAVSTVKDKINFFK